MCHATCMWRVRNNKISVKPDLSFLASSQHQNLKSTRSCSTIPINCLIRTLYPLGFIKNVLLCSSLQLPTLSSLSVLVLSILYLKESIISPLLKKSTFDKDQLSNYRPISNLFVISKVIERTVKARLTDHLSSNNLLNPHQSIINTIPLKQLCCTFIIHLSQASSDN